MNEVNRLENMELREDLSENLKFAQLTKAAVKESQRWIESITGDKFKHPDNFIRSLQDGVLLCRLANSLKAGCIKRINQMQTPVAYLDNLSVFQLSCREDFGLQEAQLFDIRDLDDLDIRGTLESEEEFRRETERRLRNILVTIYWLGRVARPLRPDTELDLRAFEALVDPSYFDFASFGEPERPPSVVGERTEVVGKNSACGNNLQEKICWESKFADWNNGNENQVHSVSGKLNSGELETTAGNGCRQKLIQPCTSRPQNNVTGRHQQISKFIEHDDDNDDDEEAPLPPNWDTFPGASTTFDSYDVDCLVEAEEGHSFALNPDTSSSSSASSFATKEFGAEDPRSPMVVQCLSSPTTAHLSASPETLAHDEISDNFERLLRDVEKFSVIRKSQSLKHLEDFDEVGFEEQETNSNGGATKKIETSCDSSRKEIEQLKTNARENGIDNGTNPSKTSERKLERRKSDFMDELLTLDEATKKYDATSSISPCNHHDPSLSSGTPASDRTSTLQSSELFERPKQRSAEATEILRQNFYGDSSSSPSSGKRFHSTYMERFVHDLENVLKFEHDGGKSSDKRRMFDLGEERKRMEEWNKKSEDKLKDKFEKDQDFLKEKLKEDLRRAHQVERMKQLQEEKFLEEEVIEVKNRRSFAAESSRSKFSKSSLSLFAPLPSKIRGNRSASPDLPPTFTSLTDDWLSQSFTSNMEKPSFDDTLPSADLVSPFEEAGKPDPSCFENDDAFEEPAWMKLQTEKVDKMSIVDVPVNRATIEVLPDSPSTSSESLHSDSLDRSANDFKGTAIDGPGFEEEVTRSTLDTRSNESAPPLKDMGAPPIPDRDDSLLVTSDILTSREQAAYLTFDTSISNFNKTSSSQGPPSFLNLTQNHRQLVASSATPPAEVLLTPSSDRYSEVYRCDPPSTITLHKRTVSSKDSISSVFPSPRSPSTDRPDFLFLRCDGSEGPSLSTSSRSSRSVDYLFAYHDDHLRRRYYWAASPVPSNCVSPVELPSDPKIGSPINRPQEKASCTGCGYCLATEQTINIYALKDLYHLECFKCKGCDAPLNAENVAIYRSVPHCLPCFDNLSRH